ncbi:hypothetical protein GGR42_003420 [Saonia flava]|mgnify:CR=1 FL=1|uniref:Uncharacterized protein n=1 Tax=Saonia flava TaxID=523696 RepID=A0A846R1S5_9FLAO|nr:hypothetical protein [Saonia flava]NJB72922.1 hypothetical protein [Saonia flava]|tara:strand:- start:28 stop:486 length:459 start_codon:yes stop_codon:yes gene_type:complete
MKRTKSGKFIEWTPIFDIKNSGYFAGVDNDGNWFADTAEGLKSLDEGGGIGILPILEMTRAEFNSYLNAKIRSSDLKPDSKLSELATKIMHLSFGISTYWAELGIEWLNESEMDSDLKNRLNYLIENKMYSQKFRHKAFAKIKQYERKKTST